MGNGPHSGPSVTKAVTEALLDPNGDCIIHRGDPEPEGLDLTGVHLQILVWPPHQKFLDS